MGVWKAGNKVLYDMKYLSCIKWLYLMSIMSACYHQYIFHYILPVKFSNYFNVFSAENFPSIRFKNIFCNGINRPLTHFSPLHIIHFLISLLDLYTNDCLLLSRTNNPLSVVSLSVLCDWCFIAISWYSG